MKRWLVVAFLIATGALLGGCATVIRSQVTAFHEQPLQLQDKVYVFERSKQQNNDLEYLEYENLVRAQLKRLGFAEASGTRPPALRVALHYGITARDVHEVYPVVVDPYWTGPGWGSYYGPFYDPLWFGPPIVERREANYQVFTRRLRITMTRIADGKAVYQTTVISEGGNGALAVVMPYMVRSAFADFPGRSGVPHYVDLRKQ